MSLQKGAPREILLQERISAVFGSVGWTKDEYDRTHLCFHATFAYTLLHFGYDLQASQCHYFPNCPTNPCVSAFGFSFLLKKVSRRFSISMCSILKKSMECRAGRGQPNHVQVQPRWQAYRLGSGCHDL